MVLIVHDWLNNHIPESLKKSESNTKQKIMNLSELKIDINTPADLKTKKYRDAFEGRYVEYKSEKDK